MNACGGVIGRRPGADAPLSHRRPRQQPSSSPRPRRRPAATTSSRAPRRTERSTVRAALNASSFDWSVVPKQVTVHVGRYGTSHCDPGPRLARPRPARLRPLRLGDGHGRVRAPGRLLRPRSRPPRAAPAAARRAAPGATRSRASPTAPTAASGSPRWSRGPTGPRRTTRTAPPRPPTSRRRCRRASSARCSRPSSACRRPVSALIKRVGDQRLPQRGRDGLRARVRVELGHGLAHVRANRLGRDEQLLADLLVRVAVGEQPQHVALALRQVRHLLGRGGAREHAGEDRIDVRPAGRDELDRPHDLGERRLLEHEPARTGVERLGQQRAVAEGGVQDHRRLGRGPPDVPRDLDPGEPGHAQVEDRDGRAGCSSICSTRLVPVARAARDLDPVLLEDVRHRLDDGGVVVGDEARRDNPPFSHESQSVGGRRHGSRNIGSGCQRATGVE